MSLVAYRRLRPVDFIVGLLAFAAVVPVSAILFETSSVFSFGWWKLLGGYGNPIFGLHRGVSGVPALVSFLTLAVVLLLQLPYAVESEEKCFRLGSEKRSWPRRIWVAFIFGLVHFIGGVPLGPAIAISIPGMVFTLVYLRRYRKVAPETLTESDAAFLAQKASERVHLAYNLIIIACCIALMPFLLFGS